MGGGDVGLDGPKSAQRQVDLGGHSGVPIAYNLPGEAPMLYDSVEEGVSEVLRCEVLSAWDRGEVLGEFVHNNPNFLVASRGARET